MELARRGRRLEWLTLGWNVVEGVVSVGAGAIAGSPSLLGFGIDSFIESLSGGVLLWRLADGDEGEARERLALRLVGVSFFLLAAYVAFESIRDLALGDAPGKSVVGIAIATASLVVMPVLARAKRRVASALGSRALEADSRQTDLCAWLSAIVLGGLALNAAFGWWWADPVAGLVMAPIVAREGWEAWRGERCECDGACEAQPDTSPRR